MKTQALALLIMLLSVCISGQAAPVSPQQARIAAENFLVKRFPATKSDKMRTQTVAGSSAMVIQGVGLLEADKKLVGYVIPLAPKGYILLSTNDQAPPVKLYSDNGAFDALPPGFRAVIETEMLEDLANLSSPKTMVTANTSSISQYSNQWNELLYPSAVNVAMAEPLTGAPGITLLTTTWNQNDPYNYYCPVAAGGPGGRATAGCVATALAQILRHHMMPISIASDYTYSDVWGSCQGTHSISDAGMGAYDWPNMPSSISTSSPEAQKRAIGQLIYHCGVVLEADYEAGATPAGASVDFELSTYFTYTSSNTLSKSHYTDADWYNMIGYDIDSNRPIFYVMNAADDSSSHAMVCDGYRNGNEIHLDMGWSGAWTAWYNMDSVSAGGYTWTIHSGVFNIAPIFPPLPPSSITYPTDSNTGQYTVSWSSSTGASAYVLQRSSDGGTSWLQIFLGSATSYSERVGNGSYQYQVQAFNAGGTSSWMTGTTDCIVSVSLPPNADINVDNRIDFLDLCVLAQEWTNTCAADANWCSNADLDRSGAVDFEDFAVLAMQWHDIIVPDDMMLITGGMFQMGDSFGEGYSAETPVHTVTLDSFYIAKSLITNSQYCAYLNSTLQQGLITVTNGMVYKAGSGTSYLYCSTSSALNSKSQIAYSGGVFSVRTKGGRDMSNDPMVTVSWYGSVAYCNWRSQQESREQCYDLSTWVCDFAKQGYRLPTEAEWEYAARGGLSGSRYPWGDTISRSQANYTADMIWDPVWDDGIRPITSPVNSYPPNEYGLYDMAGNVWEWCNDWYSDYYYQDSPVGNPTGPASDTYRIRRGGSWTSQWFDCRVAKRGYRTPLAQDDNNGFRILLDLN